MNRRPLSAFALLGLVILPGCTVGPDYVAPKAEVPANWSEPHDNAAAATRLAGWWRGFGDPLLNELIDRALKNNEDLAIARERIAEVRAVRATVEADAGPEVRVAGNAANENSSQTLKYPPGLGNSKLYQATIEASWDLDLFGANRRALEAADASVGMAEEDRRIITVNLLAELVSDYATLRTSQSRLAIAQHNIGAERDALALTERAFKAGLEREMDVERARAQVKASEAELPAIRTAIARMEHAIALLLGAYPDDLKGRFDEAGAIRLPDLPAEVPSDLLRNRPDIRKAERALARDVAQEGVATADLFPHFKIPLSFGPMVSSLGDLFMAKSLAWSLGVAGSQTVFDGGRRDARLEAAESRTRQDRLAYQRAVRQAFREVEDAWVGYAGEQERRESLESAAQDERQALDQATRLYASGLTDFLKVLDSERAVFRVEDDLARNDLARVTAVIALYKAMGAGWQEEGPNASTIPQ